MDTSRFGTQTIELLSCVTRQKLSQREIAPLIIFLVNLVLNDLSQTEKNLDRRIQISDLKKHEILEKMGEASGRDMRIRMLASNMAKEVYEQAFKSLNEGRSKLDKIMVLKSKLWKSRHNPVFSQDKLIEDYTNNFIKDLSREIDEWGNKVFRYILIKENLDCLDENIAHEIEAIQGDFQRLDQQISTNFSERMNLYITGISDEFMGLGGIGGGLGVGGALAAGLLMFTGLGFIAIVVAVAAAIASSFGLGMLDVDGLKDKIKQQVIEVGLKKLDESIDKGSEKLEEIINTVFESRVESVSQVIAQAIALYENLLEQQEKAHQETLEQREAEKELIHTKRQKLEQLQKDLEALLPSV